MPALLVAIALAALFFVVGIVTAQQIGIAISLLVFVVCSAAALMWWPPITRRLPRAWRWRIGQPTDADMQDRIDALSAESMRNMRG